MAAKLYKACSMQGAAPASGSTLTPAKTTSVRRWLNASTHDPDPAKARLQIDTEGRQGQQPSCCPSAAGDSSWLNSISCPWDCSSRLFLQVLVRRTCLPRMSCLRGCRRVWAAQSTRTQALAEGGCGSSLQADAGQHAGLRVVLQQLLLHAAMNKSREDASSFQHDGAAGRTFPPTAASAHARSSAAASGAAQQTASRSAGAVSGAIVARQQTRLLHVQ